MKWLDDLTEWLKGFGDRLQQNPRSLDQIFAKTEWTEEELVDWMNRIPKEHRNLIAVRAIEARDQGQDPVEFLRRARIEYEAGQRGAAGSGMSLLDLWWEYECGVVAGDLFMGKYLPDRD